MRADIIIRAERPDDALTITEIAVRAYADVAYSDHREHLMIERLRGSDAFIPALSLYWQRSTARLPAIFY